MAAVATKADPAALRYETKYLVSDAVRAALLEDIQGLTSPDTHAQAAFAGYAVESLYFDTPSFAAYTEKMDGNPRRTKFRMRQYGGDPSTRRLEAKEKFGNQIQKRRARLNEESERACVKGFHPGDGDVVLRQFSRDRARHALRPCIVVGYRRHAFVGRADRTIRVTFDTELHAWRATSLDSPRAHATPLLATGQTILELKWRTGFPFWMQTIVRKYSLRNLALSKYCLGVDALVRRGALPHV